MKAKRVLSFLLVTILLMTIFAGCGDRGAAEQNEPEPNAVTESENTEAVSDDNEGEPYEVTMIHVSLGTTPPDMDMVLEEINKIAIPETNTKLSMIPIALGDLSTQTTLMLSSGEKVDLVMSWSGITPVSTLVSKGYIMELDDLVKQYGSDILEAELIAMAGGYYDGKLYAVPSEEKYGRPQGMLMRTDILEKYSLEVHDFMTYDELEEVFKVVKENEPDLITLGLVGSGATSFGGAWYPVDNLGSTLASGGLLDAGQGDTTVLNIFATDEYASHVGRMREWYQAGYIASDVLTITESVQELTRADRMFSFMASTEPGQPENYIRDCNYDMTPVTLAEANATTSLYQTTMWVIPSYCENPEKTMEFLNLTYKSEEIVNLLSNGIEGVHYVKTDQDMIIDYPEGIDINSTGFNVPLHIYGDKMKKYAWYPTESSVFDDLKVLNEEVAQNGRSRALGYTVNVEGVKNEFTAVTNVIEEYRFALETGSVDPETILPEFITKLENAGINAIIEENQKQLDAWLADNE